MGVPVAPKTASRAPLTQTLFVLQEVLGLFHALGLRHARRGSGGHRVLTSSFAL